MTTTDQVYVVIAALALWVSLWLWFTIDTRMNHVEEQAHQRLDDVERQLQEVLGPRTAEPPDPPPPPDPLPVPPPRQPGRHRTPSTPTGNR